MLENCNLVWKKKKIEAIALTCSVKIGVLKSFPIFTGKYLCWTLVFNKVAGAEKENSA